MEVKNKSSPAKFLFVFLLLLSFAGFIMYHFRENPTSYSQFKEQVNPIATQIAVGVSQAEKCYLDENNALICPTLEPPPLTPTATLPAPTIPQLSDEQAQAFIGYMEQTYGGIFYGGRPADSLVTDPNTTVLTPSGDAYSIPDETLPEQTQFCLDNYGQWATSQTKVFAKCPLFVEAFTQAGLDPNPQSGVNANKLSVDKMLAQTTQESGGNPHIVSYAGAAGNGQIMPSNGFIDMNYANSCARGSCVAGSVNPPDTAEARQAYKDFYSSCSGYNWDGSSNKYTIEINGGSCLNPRFMFADRPTVEQLFGLKDNIAWMVQHMNELTQSQGYIAALQIYFQGSTGGASNYTSPICSILASNSQEDCY